VRKPKAGLRGRHPGDGAAESWARTPAPKTSKSNRCEPWLRRMQLGPVVPSPPPPPPRKGLGLRCSKDRRCQTEAHKRQRCSPPAADWGVPATGRSPSAGSPSGWGSAAAIQLDPRPSSARGPPLGLIPQPWRKAVTPMRSPSAESNRQGRNSALADEATTLAADGWSLR